MNEREMQQLVWFLISSICTQFVLSRPQNLQHQLRIQLDPLNQPESKLVTKDHGKRTIFSNNHYVYGKHVAFDPLGQKILLGYTPFNVKYQPVLKPLGVFKPALQQQNIVAWRPQKQYLPSSISMPNAVQFADNGWKPILSPSVLTISKPTFDHLKPWDIGLNSEVIKLSPAQPVQPVRPIEPVNFPRVGSIQPVHSIQQVSPGLPLVQTVIKPEVSDSHIKPLLSNYYYFQTPVSKPVVLPHHPLFEVNRPQLPVLPLGSTFPAQVSQHQNHPAIHPHQPIVFQSQSEIPFIHDHHVSLLTSSHSLPHQPIISIPPISNENSIFQPHLAEPAQPMPISPAFSVPVSFPPLKVEFHGNHQLNPFNMQPHSINDSFLFPNHNPSSIFYAKQPHRAQFPINSNEYISPVTHLHPINSNQILHHSEVLSNPAVRPGHNDLHIPDHLPQHPQFTSIHDHNLLPQFSSNTLKPSISLQPPFSSLHN